MEERKEMIELGVDEESLFELETIFEKEEEEARRRLEEERKSQQQEMAAGDERYLREGEKLFVSDRRGVKNEGDKLKRECFVKLAPREGLVEHYRCRKCWKDIVKEKEEKKEGEKGKRSEVRNRISVFYTHITICLPERIREMRVEELPREKDSLKCLKRFFEKDGWKEGMKEKIEELLAGKCYERKGKVKKEGEEGKKDPDGEEEKGEGEGRKRKERDGDSSSITFNSGEVSKRSRLIISLPPASSSSSSSSTSLPSSTSSSPAAAPTSSSSSSNSSTPSPSNPEPFPKRVLPLPAYVGAEPLDKDLVKDITQYVEKNRKNMVSFLSFFSCFFSPFSDRRSSALLEPTPVL